MIGGMLIGAGALTLASVVLTLLAYIDAANARAELEAIHKARSEATARGNRTKAQKRREHVEATRQAVEASTRRAA